MSLANQTVVRGPSLRGLGKRPDLTPCHHVDFETGIGPVGARIEESRTKPDWGKSRSILRFLAIESRLRAAAFDTDLAGLAAPLAELAEHPSEWAKALQ